jgi:thiamine transport system permease protein
LQKNKFSVLKLWVKMKKIVTILALIFSGVVCIFFILPFIFAISPLWDSSNEGLAIGGSSFLFKPILRAVFFTIKVAVGSTIIAIIFGIPTAFFVSHRHFVGKKLLKILSAVPLCIPSLLIALGYVLLFGMNGSINRFCKFVFGLENPPITFLYSFWGIIIAQGFYNFPLIMRSVADAWIQIPQDEANAARLLGASEKRIFRTVTMYQIFPAVASSSILVFLFCFFSFIIVLLLGSIGGTTLEVAIYQSTRSTLDFKTAALLALLETSVAILIIIAYSRLEKYSAHSSGISCEADEHEITAIGYKKWQNGNSKHNYGEIIGFCVLEAFIVICFLLPLISIVVYAFLTKGNLSSGSSVSLQNFIRLFGRESFKLSFLHTFQTALGTACLSVITGLVFAIITRRIDPYNSKRSLRIFPLLPMAVSSVVMGFGITMLVRQGKPYMLVLAQSALYWPFAFRQIIPALERIPETTLEAARLLSGEATDVFFKIEIPLVKRSILSSFGFCFAISCGDASLPLVLAIPRYDTLALLTYRLAGAYRFGEACAGGCVLGLLTAGIFELSDWIEKRGKNARVS